MARIRPQSVCWVSLLALLASSAGLRADEPASLTTVEISESDEIAAQAVSSDGTVVVGRDGTQAIQWTNAAGKSDLGTTGSARGVSANGGVIVGGSSALGGNGRDRAFRWTQAGGIENLGVLNSDGSGFIDESRAHDVSADGSVIVGASVDGATLQSRAVRWVGTAIESLGVLSGGNDSFAYGISADGSTIVGSSDSGSGVGQEAFRWTEAGGMVGLGKLNGGNVSEAKAVSRDGSVVVGQAADGNAFQSQRAFRWTAAGGLVSLGSLNNGSSSRAHDISADGMVVVGSANNGADGLALRGFRWTEAGGMQTVEDWLRAAGANIAADTTRSANGVNDDGTVVVGETADGDMFIARGPASVQGGGGNEGGGQGDGGGQPQQQAGLITVNDLSDSLGSAAGANAGAVTGFTVVMNAAGSRPLDRRADIGKAIMWTAGDIGTDDHGARDGGFGTGEIGLGYNFGPVQLDLSAGFLHHDQDTQLGGRTEMTGNFARLQAMAPLARTDRGGLWLVVSGAVLRTDANIRRNYVANGGAISRSTGSSELDGKALRARLEWENALPWISPYVDLSWSDVCLAGYTETGGAFPARFNTYCNEVTEGRYGVDTTYPLAPAYSFIATLEGVHRFDSGPGNVTGSVVGLAPFNISAASYDRDWVRGGVGFEARLGDAVLSMMANGTSKGESPDVWLAANLRSTF